MVTLDHRGVVDQYLAETLGMVRTQSDYRLLQVRRRLTQREIDMLTRKFGIYLHPDKFPFEAWVTNKYTDTDTVSVEVLAFAKENLKDFYQVVRDTKLRLIDLDDGHYEQAWIHKLYTIILMIRCVVQSCMCKL